VVQLHAKAATLERKQKLENKAEKLRLEEEIAIAEGRDTHIIPKNFPIILFLYSPKFPNYS
jgi:hypothetical protein